MPRNGSGTYSLPAGNPVVIDTTISSSTMNSTLTDVGTALTGSLAANGETPVTANLPMGGYILTGLGAGGSTGQSLRYEQLFTTGTVTLLGRLTIPDGTVGAPGIRWSSSSTTGIFSSSDNTVRFACAGAEGARAIASGLYVTGGGVTFPAVQVPSADPNTLDDYAEADVWTSNPVLTFATPGDLSVAYSTRVATVTKAGRLVCVTCDIALSTFTFTTASGVLQITNLPFTSKTLSGLTHHGSCSVQGITKAGYTTFSATLGSNSSTVLITANGSGVNESSVSAADMPSGGAVIIRFSMFYIV